MWLERPVEVVKGFIDSNYFDVIILSHSSSMHGKYNLL